MLQWRKDLPKAPSHYIQHATGNDTQTTDTSYIARSRTTRHIPPRVEVICGTPGLPQYAPGVAAEQVPGKLCELARKITCTTKAVDSWRLQNQCDLHSQIVFVR